MNHSDSENISYCRSLIEVLSDTLALNATEVNFHIDDYVCTDLLDERYQKRCNEQECLVLGFNYGDYFVKCCLCGYIAIIANETDYQAGNVKLPRSMRMYSENVSQDLASGD
jgi:hypothetical protein